MTFCKVEADRKNIADKSVFPVAHNQLSEPFDFAPGDPTYADAFVGGTAAVQECGIPYVGGAAPAVHNYGIAPVGLAAPVPDNDADTMIERPVPAQDDPFVTSITTSSAFSPSASTAASSAQIAPGPDPVSGPASAPQQAPQRAPRHTWSDAERARLMFLKEEAGLKWDAIHRVSKETNKRTYTHTHTHRQLMKLSKVVRRNLKFTKLTSIPDCRFLALTPSCRLPTSTMNFAAREGASRSKLSRGNAH